MTKRVLADYPKIYFEIAEHFEKSRERITLKMEQSEAHAIRRDFYRFLTTLRETEDDQYAENLLMTVGSLMVSVIPSIGERETPTDLIFKMSPLRHGLAIAISERDEPIHPPAEEPPPAKPTPPPTPEPEPEDLIDVSEIDSYMNTGDK